MSWRDELQPASFRGARFWVTSSTSSLGRRTVIHEYPLRDGPVTEDLGRRKRSWRLDLFVLGIDYKVARDLLITALETAGPGQLVHPHYGSIQVVVDGDVELTETSNEGGMATFRAGFVEAGDLPTLKTSVDTATRVNTAATAVQAQAAAQLDQVWDASSDDYRPELYQRVIELLAPLSQALHQVLNPTLQVPGIELAGWCWRTVNTIAERLEPQDSLRTLLLQAETSVRVESATTTARAQQVASLQGLIGYQQQISVARACQLATAMTWRDRSSVYETLQTFLERLEACMGATDASGESLSVDMLQALQALRVAVTSNLTQRALALPQIVVVSIPGTLPALVVAYALFQDLAREAQLLELNSISHPGFVPAGSLEVLSG